MAQQQTLALYVGNDMLIELQGLKNTVENAWVNDATVTVHLRTRGGADVAGATWPLDMLYVEASSGDYRAGLPAALSVTAGAWYVAQIAVADGANVARWDMDAQAQLRRS